MSGVRILHGDCRTLLPTLPAASVHACVTSPPYFGLRAYLPDGHPDKGKEIGLEPTPELYVAQMVAVFREVRRVLRDDGTLWLNLGDSYASGPPGNKTVGVSAKSTLNGVNNTSGIYRETLAAGHATKRDTSRLPGLKPKDLIGIPWRVAFALQADGWYLRDCVIWHKPNPMPESVRDRTTKAHEFVFMLTKKATYFYDADAIAEPAQERVVDSWEKRKAAGVETRGTLDNGHNSTIAKGVGFTHNLGNGDTRNARSVWTIASQPFSESHFATMPPDLAERCIKAGTSEKGCCPGCGAPWERVLESRQEGNGTSPRGAIAMLDEDGTHHGQNSRRGEAGSFSNNPALRPPARATLGWQPTCTCPAHAPVPCTVLDPFSGAGTTGLVADRLQRHYIGIELNGSYRAMSQERIRADAPLFAGAP